MQPSDQHIYGDIDATKAYWENLLSVGNGGNENNYVEHVWNHEDDEQMKSSPASVLNNNTIVLSSEESEEYSSTGSSDICLIADFEAELDRALFEAASRVRVLRESDMAPMLHSPQLIREGIILVKRLIITLAIH